MNGKTIITTQPIAVMRRRPYRSDRCPNSGIVTIETNDWTITKLRISAAAEPELLRGVGEDVGREDVERHLLARAQQRGQQDLAPVPPQHLDDRRLLDGAPAP